MKERTKAYMAGLMDADGTFCITTCIHNVMGHRLFDPTVRLTTTFKPVSKWAVKMFGGTVYNHKITGTSKLPRWDWSTDGYKHSEGFVRSILPYLSLKKDAATVILEFYGLFRQQVPKKRMELCNKLSDINHRESLTTETQDLNFDRKLINAYFAGFFDGEGSVSFSSDGKTLTITLGNTAKAHLHRLEKIYGGHTYPMAGDSRPEHRQPMFQWQISKKQGAEKFLLSILPYLIVKKEQAVKALEFIRSKKIQSELVSDYESAAMETLTA